MGCRIVPTRPSPRSLTVQNQSFAARAGRWSAQHRRKAVLGWLAFVILAVFIGGKIGTNTIPSDQEGLSGDSKRAQQITEDAYPQSAAEQIFIQSRTQSPSDPGFRAAVRDVEHRLAGQ